MHLASNRVSAETVQIISPDLGILEKVFDIFPVPIDMITNSVTYQSRKEIEGYERLVEKLQSTMQMATPIICIENTEDNYLQAIYMVLEEYVEPFNPDKRLLALTGNSTLSWAVENGVESIDAYIVPDMHWMHALQLKINNGVISNKK